MTSPHLTRLIDDFLRDDAGSPLGMGMPSGSPLRADGQSHYEAWLAVMRRDPCVYCAAGGGTVDHVEPRSRAARGLGTPHGWINTAGACARCNGAKRDLGLLVFLHRRRWQGATTACPARPAHASSPPRAGGHVRLRLRPPPALGLPPPEGGAGAGDSSGPGAARRPIALSSSRPSARRIASDGQEPGPPAPGLDAVAAAATEDRGRRVPPILWLRAALRSSSNATFSSIIRAAPCSPARSGCHSFASRRWALAVVERRGAVEAEDGVRIHRLHSARGGGPRSAGLRDVRCGPAPASARHVRRAAVR